MTDNNEGKVTGIGGVFFLANENNAELSAWYEKHLGIALEPWGGGYFVLAKRPSRGWGLYRMERGTER